MSAKTNAIKASLALFSPTFSRLPHIQLATNNLKQTIRSRYDMFTLGTIHHKQHRFVSSCFVYRQAGWRAGCVAAGRNNIAYNFQSHFDRKYDGFSFDYQNACFKLHRRLESQNQRVSDLRTFDISVQAIDVENFDHPFKRHTLYFHELKDMHKYGKFQTKKGVPKQLQNFDRKRIQNQLLDQKNPLGIPKWSKPLKINIQAKSNDVLCGFDLHYHLGEIRLNKCYNKRPQYSHTLDPFVMDEKSQQMIFLFLKKRAGITKQEVEEMSKLAFIGGRVKKLELMMNMILEICQGLEKN